MTTPRVFLKMAGYGVALGAIDAVFGRTLQAAPDPSTLLALLATGWAASDLAATRPRIAVPAALTLWAAYFAGFVATAHLLVGWNNSVPWRPESWNWVFWFALGAVGVSFAAASNGKRASKAEGRANPVGPS